MVNLLYKGKIVDELCTNKGYADLIKYLDNVPNGKQLEDLITFINHGFTNKCSKVAGQAKLALNNAPVALRGILLTVSKALNGKSGMFEVD